MTCRHRCRNWYLIKNEFVTFSCHLFFFFFSLLCLSLMNLSLHSYTNFSNFYSTIWKRERYSSAHIHHEYTYTWERFKYHSDIDYFRLSVLLRYKMKNLYLIFLNYFGIFKLFFFTISHTNFFTFFWVLIISLYFDFFLWFLFNATFQPLMQFLYLRGTSRFYVFALFTVI